MERQVERIVIVWVVFALLCSVYLLTYRGLFQSVDELNLFAVTESLVQTRSLQTPQLAFAEYHNQVGRFEPLQSLLATPLYWLAVRSAWLGNIHTVMLFNVLVTALTGAVLCVLLEHLGHSSRRAFLGALLYGLATIAWPYSRSFFREPLVGLLLAVAALGWVRWRQTGRSRFLALIALCLALAPAAKTTTTLVWPAFGLAFVFAPHLTRQGRALRLASVIAISVLAAVLLAALYAVREGSGPWSVLAYLRTWTAPMVVLPRIYGLLLGSGRGLFVFSPVLLLCLPGLVLLWRRHRSEALLVAGALVLFVVGYSSYTSWHGGLVWGSRFLVPVVPLLMLPVVECLSATRKVWQLAAALLIVVSVFVQLVASTADYSIQVTGNTWANLLTYGRSPVVQQIALWRPENFDMLWWHGPLRAHLADVYVNGWIALLPTTGLACAVALAILTLRRSGADGVSASSRLPWVGSAFLGLVLVAGMFVLLGQALGATGGYAGVNPAELQQVAGIVNQGYGESRVIVTVSNDFHVNVLLDGFKGRFVHHWLSPLQEGGLEMLLRPSLPAQSLHLIVDSVHMPPDQTGRAIELWLNARLYRYATDWVGGGYGVYSYLYPPQDPALSPVDYRWSDGMAMLSVGLTPDVVKPGEPLWTTLRFSAFERPRADYDLFVQLLAPDGRFVNGIDGPPQFGAALTSSWQPDGVVVDRRALLVPEGAPEGTYRVVAGFYRGNERQAVVGGEGQVLGTHVELGEIKVIH
jgi:hypothetical protein